MEGDDTRKCEPFADRDPVLRVSMVVSKMEKCNKQPYACGSSNAEHQSQQSMPSLQHRSSSRWRAALTLRHHAGEFSVYNEQHVHVDIPSDECKQSKPVVNVAVRCLGNDANANCGCRAHEGQHETDVVESIAERALRRTSMRWKC